MYKIYAIVGAVLLFGAIYWMNSGTTLDAEANPELNQFTNQTATTTDGVSDTQPPTTPVVTDTGSQQPSVAPNKIMKATLRTSMGDITIEFSPATAPKTVENFVKLAQSGFYDNTKFHRVIKGFMNQGGDPLSKDDSMMNQWGTGGPGYKFADEITASNKNAAGTISMANAGPNTNGSQFFINAADNFSLDSKHTVFGKVIAGMDVVNAINATPTDGNDRPLTPVVIQSITLQ